jgi:hypothetical protein
LSAANILGDRRAANVNPGDVTSPVASPYTVTIQSERATSAQIAVVAGSPDVSGGTVVAGTTTQGGSGGQIYEATTSGTSAGSVPTTPRWARRSLMAASPGGG